MRFLPEQKNKQIWSVALLLIAVAGIAYFNFFSGPPKPQPPPKPVAAPPGAGAALPPAKQVVKKSQGGLLPYGTNIEIAVIEQEKFKVLKPATPLLVAPEELGKEDLFSR